jgi:hypothetical protein
MLFRENQHEYPVTQRTGPDQRSSMKPVSAIAVFTGAIVATALSTVSLFARGTGTGTGGSFHIC